MMERMYRGKRTDNGEWVEGAYYKQTEFYGDPWESHYIITSKDVLEDNMMIFHEVSPETVGQYVRDDCNGKRAFEGDIINNGFIIGVIRFGEYQKACNDDKFASHIGFYVEWSGGKSLHNILRKDVGFWLNRTSVIGNIHDNPKLLNPATDHADSDTLAPAT